MKPLLIRPAALVCHQFPIGLAVDPSALPPPHAVSVRRPDGWGGSFEPGSPADVPPRPGEVVCTCGGPDGCTVEIGWGKHHEVGAVRATFFQAPRLAEPEDEAELSDGAPRALAQLEFMLRNLYLPSVLRCFWRGLESALAKRLERKVGNQEAKETTNIMKKHVEAATAAFGALLTALIAIYTSIKGSAPAATADDGELETTAPEKPKKGKATPPPADDDDMLGGDEEQAEPEVTIEQLRAAGQAAIKAGKADKMKAVLKKHGAENLGGLSKDDYAPVLAALKKLA